MIGLIDVDGKLPNLALMKISSYYKSLGEKVEFVRPDAKKSEYEKVFASTLFTKSADKCEKLLQFWEDKIEIGGTGYGDITKRLPPEIEVMKPDYDLYTTEIIYPNIKGKLYVKKKRRRKELWLEDTYTKYQIIRTN